MAYQKDYKNVYIKIQKWQNFHSSSFFIGTEKISAGISLFEL